ncbi:MAG: hypothetical protein KGO51_14495 [Alphaproteobacteria bacterium]|nr:hypothetical protein [Alphaproteobacteria bacterium]
MQTAATAGRGGAGRATTPSRRAPARHLPHLLRRGPGHRLRLRSAKDDYVQLDPGAAYNLIRAGADTAVDMEKGDEIILKNVTLSRLPAAWIFDG